jgi:hypothetical protein
MKKKNTICVGHRYTETNTRPENQSKTQHKERLLSPVFIAKAKVAIIYVYVNSYFILLKKKQV